MVHDEIEWFITIAEAENLTAAGERLAVSQPTLSRFVGSSSERSALRCSTGMADVWR